MVQDLFHMQISVVNVAHNGTNLWLIMFFSELSFQNIRVKCSMSIKTQCKMITTLDHATNRSFFTFVSMMIINRKKNPTLNN